MNVDQKFSLSTLQKLMGEQAITIIIEREYDNGPEQFQILDWNATGFTGINLDTMEETDFGEAIMDDKLIAVYTLVPNLETYVP